VHSLRASRHHFLQQLPQPPLPQVSDGCPGPLDRRAPEGTSPDALRPRSLYTSRQLARLALQNKKLIYGLLLRASAETLLEVARDPRHLGAEMGFFSVLHSWNQKLSLHPHVHCVIPAGGLSLDHTHWIKSRSRFFLSIKVLRRVFRGKFVAGLKQAFQNGRLHFSGKLAPLTQPKTFAAWLRPLFRKDWVVYAKPPFGGPEYVLQYLGRYTHRVAISNHRLVSFTEGKVTFRWRDSAHNNEQKLMTLPIDEFLRRFLLHLLPKGFVRIRNFGFLANRKRATNLPLCMQLLGSAAAPPIEQDRSGTNNASDLWRCPKCGGTMVVVERLTSAEIQLRSPPLLTSAG
jgi:Putative transposase